ncbi:hypothetical protein J4E83_010597 [Alternaria metachromatica]|uniref:uncharacterized protein n=1 Tax=Alternaria metachromatica TaxID=283354 RepID=UPI0020C2F8D5|nr:uncharacterized protein J4E83_010597 [Alternaria metachromatica]KAI4605399.1 hypothetical protein J4E83_010597 [Alternaria metachromatica]
MVSAMERKRHGVVDFDQQLMEQGQSDTLSFDSSDDTLTSLPAISKLESTDAILERTTTIVESNNEAERSMSLREGIRLYPKAITWSVLLSMTLIMEGFSTILVPNLFAMQPFRKQFGTLQSNGLYEISADWQSALVNGGLAGQIVGLFATGILAERIGYVNACWVLGQLIASIVMRGMINNTTTWSYRIPFALQWIFPVPILFAVYFAPESPWWLIRQDRFVDAMKTMRRLRTQPASMSDDEFDKTLNGAMEAMIQTNEREQQMQSGTSYKDCFKGVDRRRTEITCMVWIIQTLCGSTFMGFSTYFYEQAGLGSSHAFTLSLGQFALGLVGVFISWALMAHFGRRTLYLSGQVMTFAFVLLIGILACIPHRHHFVTVRSAVVGTPSQVGNPHPTALNWSIAALLLAFTLAYDATLGPICYALVSEIPSTRLRSKTIVLARNCYNISGIVTNIITPRMLNPTAWGWGAKAGFFWAGTSVIGILWSWWRLPEPKGRTFGELDELFERKVVARKFKTTDFTVGGVLIARTEKSRV